MERESVIFALNGKTLTASILVELDHHSAKGVRELIDGRLFYDRPEVLVLDFSGVGFMDSSGVALILARCECAKAIGAEVRVRGLSESLYKLLKLSGVDRVKNLTVSGL